ncbi:MAG: TlpA family protein disulfide reductase [Anaerotignum sp.]|nr:TlpA family protein disulfide reductase [Anaerotignum sp.]
MKKKFALLLAMVMLFAVGCGKDDSTNQAQQEIQREFDLPQCGLSYTIPEEWTEMENCNLIPISFVSTTGEIYAKIQYNYAPDDNMAALNDTSSTIPIEELMTPIAEMLVVKAENLETAAVKDELALFSSVEELPAHENYHFYFMTDYADGIDHFDSDAQDVFKELETYLPELKDSIETSLPDAAAVQETVENDGKYLNFISKTLEGDPISSTVFYDYDLTVVNFWASYCYTDNIVELDTLQTFYKDLQKKHPNVNFIQVVIDTPGENAEKIAQDAYDEYNVTFTGVMPDQNMAAWIMENLNGLPTTIFVDSQGMPRDLKVEGMQDAAYYMETTENMLKAIEK